MFSMRIVLPCNTPSIITYRPSLSLIQFKTLNGKLRLMRIATPLLMLKRKNISAQKHPVVILNVLHHSNESLVKRAISIFSFFKKVSIFLRFTGLWIPRIFQVQILSTLTLDIKYCTDNQCIGLHNF